MGSTGSRGARGSDPDAACRCEASLVRQVRRAHGASRPHAWGDATPSAGAFRCDMVTGALIEPQRPNIAHLSEERVWRVLRSVLDPEIPVLTIVDLGIVRYVRSEGGALRV